MKKITNKMIGDRRKNYNKEKKEKVLGADKNNFFKCINSFLNHSEAWDVRTMYPGLEDEVIANEVAVYFNRISNEYPALDVDSKPITFDEPLPDLTEEDVLKLLKESKIPRSTVTGDMFPESVKRNYGRLTRPLCSCLLYTSPSPRD